MPDKKGWRNRLQEKRPKTPVAVKSAGEASHGQNDTTDGKSTGKHRSQQMDKLNWRPSCPQIPATVPSASAGVDWGDVEDARSDITNLDSTTPSRPNIPRPRLSRFMSDYLTLSNASKGVAFSEPWSEDAPPILEPPMDPLLAVQAVRSHIYNLSTKPIPVEHNSGLLRVFEDYRKTRYERDRLDAILQETLEGYKTAEETWLATEARYESEIRRLELLIARGTTGMTGLMHARQGTVVDRKRPHRKTLSADRLETVHGFLSQNHLDEEIKSRIQKAVLYRPSSPSSKMAALSRQFSTSKDPGGTIPTGTPPSQDMKVTLSRKVKSELDLAKMINLAATNDPRPETVDSGSSIPDDPWPDKVKASGATVGDTAFESEVFVSLRELAVLVARRRGINAELFVTGLMKLFSIDYDIDECSENSPESQWDEGDTIKPTVRDAQEPREANIRQTRSRPRLAADHNRRRHFSFEPGDDRLGALSEEIKKFDFNRPKSAAGSQSTQSSEPHDDDSDERSESSNADKHSALMADVHKPSKIPSPLQRPTMGRVRRENSGSSLQTVHQLDDRRNSRSSVTTAFRENSSSSLRRPGSSNRSSSFNNLPQVESLLSKDQNSSLRLRNSVLALAAARAAGTSSPVSGSDNPFEKGDRKASARSSTTRPSPRPEKSPENEDPRGSQ